MELALVGTKGAIALTLVGAMGATGAMALTLVDASGERDVVGR